MNQKKRLIVELDPADFAAIKSEATAKGLTLANYVRRSLRLPEERQGVKRIGTKKSK
jgi:predicted DNA binding CopG/RHH family protein